MPTLDEWAQVKRDPAMGGAVMGKARIQPEMLQAIVDHARLSLPNESCGLLIGSTFAADGGAPARYRSLHNAAQSPYRYMIDPREQLTVWMEMDDADEVPWGIVHSHVASPAVPSATDVGLAFFPDSLYLVCSLMDDMPTIRAWSIRDGVMTEVPLAVT